MTTKAFMGRRMMPGKMPEAKDKPLWRVMYDAHTYGGDPAEVLLYRATKAESLLRQIACNTDPVWARKLACDFWGIEAPPADGAEVGSPKVRHSNSTKGRDEQARFAPHPSILATEVSTNEPR